MSRIRSHDTSIELAVRRYLYSQGFRYRLHSKLAGRPDLVFPRYRIAVFVNGCFWHMHGCRLSAIPSTRRDFWIRKLEGNRRRDALNLKNLSDAGWTTVTIWECDVLRNVAEACAVVIRDIETKVT
jgi:DNA mismatch endonuclease (patch repair protein)